MVKKSVLVNKYIQNPDAVLREEDEDGGLLFNPDTNQVKVINTTGLFIWKQFDKANNLKSVVDAIKNNYDEVSDEEIMKDATEFLAGMVETGFFGIVEDK